MCDFPSWIEVKGQAVFSTDDILPPNANPADYVGHEGIRKLFPGTEGVDREGYPCHPEVAKAIMAGKMRKLMESAGHKSVSVNANGNLHRLDGPAYERSDGTKAWYLNGKLHHLDGPAYERANGSKEWYLNGKRHRVDGPAYEWADGSKAWYLNGKPHRLDGPAYEYADGTKVWYLNGKLHRLDGPACEWANGTKEWYLNGKLHRSVVQPSSRPPR